VSDPGHPYTRALLSAVPEADPVLTRSKERLALQNQNIPSLLNLPSACTFHPRCPLFAVGVCDTIEPALSEYGAGQSVACHITTGNVVAREHVAV
jgi:peptide/nickel transport system ATP-binding protein